MSEPVTPLNPSSEVDETTRTMTHTQTLGRVSWPEGIRTHLDPAQRWLVDDGTRADPT